MLQGNAGLKPKEGELTSQPWMWPINYKVSSTRLSHNSPVLFCFLRCSGSSELFMLKLKLKFLFAFARCVFFPSDELKKIIVFRASSFPVEISAFICLAIPFYGGVISHFWAFSSSHISLRWWAISEASAEKLWAKRIQQTSNRRVSINLTKRRKHQERANHNSSCSITVRPFFPATWKHPNVLCVIHASCQLP